MYIIIPLTELLSPISGRGILQFSHNDNLSNINDTCVQYLASAKGTVTVKPIYWKSWARNLLIWSDLTLGPSFKVKQG